MVAEAVERGRSKFESEILELMDILPSLTLWERKFVENTYLNFYTNGRFTDKWINRLKTIHRARSERIKANSAVEEMV